MQADSVELFINEPQGEFLALEKPFKAFVGGFRSGKTFVGCIQIVMNALEFPSIKQGYFAPTYPQIADIFYPTISEVCDRFGLSCEVFASKKEVNIIDESGCVISTVKCRSMEHPQRIVGFDLAHALIDEIDCMKMDKADHAWKKIVARLSSVVCGRGVNTASFTTTPEGYNWVYNFFVMQLEDKPELKPFYGIVHASTLKNAANLPDDYIPKLYATYPPELVNAYVNGEFVNLTSGSVYRNYDRDLCASTETINGNEPLFIGMDFNVENMAATVYVKRDKVWHAVGEFCDYLDTPDIARAIQERHPQNKIYVYPDASGKNRKSTGASTSDIKILQNHGFTIRAHDSNPLVKDRVNAANKAFSDGLVKVNYRACPVTARCLEQQAYDKNGEPDKKSGNDHQNDATTYPIAYEMPIIVPYSTGAKLRMF